jgi:3-dehydroquinate synthetase
MDEIDNVMKHDKKIRHGKLTLPLLVELGRVQMKTVDGMPN